MWRPRPALKGSYDVVIIGGGSHGLATAYYLRQRGITNVAVLEKGYIGSGAAGRNTTILRSNYKTPEGARFYDASIKLYEGLSRELNFNLLFSQCGHLTLAHSDRAMFVMANRAEVNRLAGIDYPAAAYFADHCSLFRMLREGKSSPPTMFAPSAPLMGYTRDIFHRSLGNVLPGIFNAVLHSRGSSFLNQKK
jgi:glycine/D-amino acid oxidase-like deaminating enzyme